LLVFYANVFFSVFKNKWVIVYYTVGSNTQRDSAVNKQTYKRIKHIKHKRRKLKNTIYTVIILLEPQ